MKRAICIAAILVVIFGGAALAQEYRWYKGNTHTHTTNSDGDETPRRVVRWYFDHSYNFLVITDHNYLTHTRYLDTDANDDFILIPGEEVTDRAENKPVHVNAIGIHSRVEPKHGTTIVETLQNNTNAIREAGGVAHINHPNWKWSFGAKEIAEATGAKLLEIYNVAKECNNYAAGGAPGMEDVWDAVLSKNVLLYGVISDDTHDYVGEFGADKSNPGNGWLMVRARELTPEAIVASLEKGDFYATVGVTLKQVAITDQEYSVEIDPWGDAKYTTIFIGRDGKILKEDHSLTATYRFKGDEGYVRAKIISSTGDFAITQPVFVKSNAR